MKSEGVLSVQQSGDFFVEPAAYEHQWDHGVSAEVSNPVNVPIYPYWAPSSRTEGAIKVADSKMAKDGVSQFARKRH